METDKILRDKIDQAILSNQTLREFFNLSNPTDLLVFQRIAYFQYAIPLMVNKGVTHLSENDMNNCLIELYVELAGAGKIINPKQLP